MHPRSRSQARLAPQAAVPKQTPPTSADQKGTQPMDRPVLMKRIGLIRRPPRQAGWAAALVTSAACLAVLGATSGAATAAAAPGHAAQPGVRAVCAATADTFYRPGRVLYAHCDALLRTGIRTDTPVGYGPADSSPPTS